MGRAVIGGWALEEELSRGGFGTVWRARGPRGEVAALKVLDRGLGGEDLQRFRREVEALARVRHPGVVRILGAGFEPGSAWLAMELVPGESLQAVLSRLGRLPPARAVEVALALASALGAVHAAGLVHRDLKPANALVDPGGRVVLVDFGLALPLWEGRLTRTGDTLGTAAYMAPEQVRGAAELGPAVDVYGLGATLYALLTGEPPFGVEPVAEVMDRIERCLPTPPSARAPGVPWALDALVLRCLAKHPEERPPTAAALADLLGRALEGPAAAGRPARPERLPWRIGAAVLLGSAAAGWFASSGGSPGRALPAPAAPAPAPAAAPPAEGPRTLVLQPGPWAGQDAWVSGVGWYLNDNFGAGETLLVGSRDHGGQAGDFRAYLRFDLRALPAGARVRAARVELCVSARTRPEVELRVRAWRVEGPWVEGSSTRDRGLDGIAWDGAVPGGHFPAQSSARPELTQPDVARDGAGPEGCLSESRTATGEGWLTLDVAEAVRAWQRAPGENWGLRLARAEEGPPWVEDQLVLVSSDEHDAARRPRLVIEYEGPPPHDLAAEEERGERAAWDRARARLAALEAAEPLPCDDEALEQASQACREAPGWPRPFLVRSRIHLGRTNALGSQDTFGAHVDLQRALARPLAPEELPLARRALAELGAVLVADPRQHPALRELLAGITSAELRAEPAVRDLLERVR